MVSVASATMAISTLLRASAILTVVTGAPMADTCNPLKGNSPVKVTHQDFANLTFSRPVPCRSGTAKQYLPHRLYTTNYNPFRLDSCDCATPNGTNFTITKRYDPPYIWLPLSIFLGCIEVVVKAALGTDIIPSAVMMSDDQSED